METTRTNKHYIGVSTTRDGRFRARIRTKQTRSNKKNLGTFDTPEEAALAYDAAIRKHRGNGNGILNFPLTGKEKTQKFGQRVYKGRVCKSWYKGVHFDRRQKKKPWRACVTIGPGKQKRSPFFATEEEAAEAYERMRNELYTSVVFFRVPEGSDTEEE